MEDAARGLATRSTADAEVTWEEAAIVQRSDVIIDLTGSGTDRAVLRLATQRPSPNRPIRERMMVRLFDLVVASSMCIPAVPVAVVVGLLVRVSSGGPVLYSQERVGRGGETFRCLKFRSMRSDADEVLAELLAGSVEAREEWERSQKLRDDPRVTRVGRFIRRSSLDELPQLINVLRGEMSIVGPRPLVPTETVRYGEAMLRVLSVKPGLTGLWQVSGRNDLSYPERVALDVRYVESRSFGSDVLICLRTAQAVVAGESSGAY